MELSRKFLTNGKHLLAIVLFTAAMGVLHFFLPLVYGLNDDTMLRSILSGTYLGTPDGHAIYMRYPLTGILSTLYRITDAVPWLTIFFTVCIAACFYLILLSVWKSFTSKSNRMAGICLAASLFFLLFFRHFLIMHYTLIAALVAGTALLLTMRAPSYDNHNSYYAGSLFLLFLSYMIRSQVFFLALPFLAIAVLWKLGDTKDRVSLKQNFRSCLRYLGILLLGTLVLILTHKVMYGSDSWQKFEDYNDARTRVYDYTSLLPYEEYPDVYQEIGITESQYTLLTRYATALDDSVTTEQLNQLANATEEIIGAQISQKDLFIKRFQEYKYRAFHEQDAPYNVVVILSYLVISLLCLAHRQWYRLLLLIMLAGGRSLIWLFLMMRGRYPERVTISLYLIETLLLVGMILHFADKRKRKKTGAQRLSPLATILLIAATAVCLPYAANEVNTAYTEAVLQKKNQQEWEQLLTYMQENDDSFFYIDVYSIVSVSGMQYDTADYENYLLLGGWTTQSSLFKEKQSELGYATPAEALASGSPFYLVVKEGKPVLWFEEYLASIGYSSTFALYDRVGSYCIYVHE